MDYHRELILDRLRDIVYDKEIIEQIEKGCWEHAVSEARRNSMPIDWEGEFVHLYSEICYKVLVNIDPLSRVNRPFSGTLDDWCITQLMIGEMDPLALAKMSPEELNPHINQAVRDQIQVRLDQKIKIKTNRMYRCGNCKQNETQVKEIQTRSGDEGATLFITCIHCHHRWRIYG